MSVPIKAELAELVNDSWPVRGLGLLDARPILSQSPAVEPSKVVSFHRATRLRIFPRKTRDFPQDSFRVQLG